jgi:hypothetical protein
MIGPIWCNDCGFRVEQKEVDKSFLVNEIDEQPLKVISRLTKANFESLTTKLSNLEQLIFDNEDAFNQQFCNGQIWELVSVNFSSEMITIHYILDCGQPISRIVEIGEFVKFVEKYRLKWEDKNGKVLL